MFKYYLRNFSSLYISSNFQVKQIGMIIENFPFLMHAKIDKLNIISYKQSSIAKQLRDLLPEPKAVLILDNL